MKITIKDILEKYDTNIDINSMGNNLKNKILFNDDGAGELIDEDMVTLNDVKKPKHEQKDGYDIYEYKFKDYTMTVSFMPENYRTMSVNIIRPTEENIPEPYYVWNWDYDGKIGIVA